VRLVCFAASAVPHASMVLFFEPLPFKQQTAHTVPPFAYLLLHPLLHAAVLCVPTPACNMFRLNPFVTCYAFTPFAGDGGTIVLISVPRVRLVCSHPTPNLLQFLAATPRPPELSGKQLVSTLDNYFWRGTVYPRSIHLTDLGAFLGPGDVDEMQAYRGSNMLQVNVTRVCLTYVASDCVESAEVCVLNALQAMLQNGAHTGGLSQQARVAAIAVPLVAAGGSDRTACSCAAIVHRLYGKCVFLLSLAAKWCWWRL
jgi:hypothetical protein